MARIGIDARMLGKGYGLGRYVEQLLRGIAQYDQENQYVIFLLKVESGKQKVESVLPFQIPNSRFQIVATNVPWYSIEEQVKFASIIKKHDMDLMHFPHWNIPLLYNDPYIVTIHDLTMYHYPRPEATTHGPLVYWVKDMAHRLVVKHAVEKAKHIITTSEFTRQDVHQTLGVPLEKMTTVYQAPLEKIQNTKIQDTNNYPSNAAGRQLPITNYQKNEDSESGNSTLQRFNITKPYILYVGAAYPHKNVEGLLRAWEVFQEKYGDEYQLVLSGKDSVFYQKILAILDSTFHIQDSVVFTDFVTDEELSALYQNARAFVFPSLYEGFGLPPLEAMQYGIPVVSSNRSCLPEVLGEGAYYADPEDAGQLADALFQVCANEDVRYELKQRGREELKRYSFEKFATETLRLYTKESQ